MKTRDEAREAQIHAAMAPGRTREEAIEWLKAFDVVGRTYRMRVTDQTGETGEYDCTVRSVSGSTPNAHFARPRGDESKPAIHAAKMNTLVAALAFAQDVTDEQS